MTCAAHTATKRSDSGLERLFSAIVNPNTSQEQHKRMATGASSMGIKAIHSALLIIAEHDAVRTRQAIA